MKTHTASLKSTMTMNNSTQTLCLQSNFKACQFQDILTNDYYKSNKLWPQSPIAHHVTTYTEGIIASLYKQCHLYTSLMMGDRIFDVHYNSEDGHVEIEDSEVYDALKTLL